MAPKRSCAGSTTDGWLSFRNRPVKLGRAFAYRRVALRPTEPGWLLRRPVLRP